MNGPTLFDPALPVPRDDAAPLAGGASVNDRISHSESILARFPFVPPVRRDARDTSRAAANRIRGHAATLRLAVLDYLRERGDDGATDQEIQTALGLPSNTEIPRRWELVNAGLVVASGRKRRTRSGCAATVWIVATAATMPPAASTDAGGTEGGPHP